MSSYIYFAGENVCVKVDEAPAQVAEAFTSAHGVPFRLTAQGGRGEVYINPLMVAFWSDSEPDREPQAQQDAPPPPAKAQVVTDIWGNPLRRKRRR